MVPELFVLLFWVSESIHRVVCICCWASFDAMVWSRASSQSQQIYQNESKFSTAPAMNMELGEGPFSDYLCSVPTSDFLPSCKQV